MLTYGWLWCSLAWHRYIGAMLHSGGRGCKRRDGGSGEVAGSIAKDGERIEAHLSDDFGAFG